MRNYDGLTLISDRGLIGNKDVIQCVSRSLMKFSCSLGLYEGYPLVFVHDVYKGSLFLVLPGLFPPSNFFSHVLSFELLNAWVALCCTWAILIPLESLFSLAWSPRWLLLLWELVNSTAEHWNVQKWACKQVLLVFFIDITTCLLRRSPLIPAADSRSPPTNLFIDSETPTSLQLHWTPPDGRVQHYKITYNPVSDAGAQQTVSL